MSAPTLVTIQSVNPPGTSVTFALLGDTTYGPSSSGSSGGWQIVDRPRLVAATQWVDRAPYQLDLPLMIDSQSLLGTTFNIENMCLTVEGWQDKAAGTQQPPVLSLTGPIPGTQRQWVVYTVSFGEAIRDPNAGFRVQQQLKLSLYEYNSPLASVVGSPSPAQAAVALLNASENAQSYGTYIVNAGDTLSSIAAAQLGNYSLWTTLATLNNIRDPNSLVTGQVLKIPEGY